MKRKSPIQVIDLRIQVDHITPRKNQIFEEYRNDSAKARLFVILIRRREIERISNGNISTENRVK